MAEESIRKLLDALPPKARRDAKAWFEMAIEAAAGSLEGAASALEGEPDREMTAGELAEKLRGTAATVRADLSRRYLGRE